MDRFVIAGDETLILAKSRDFARGENVPRKKALALAPSRNGGSLAARQGSRKRNAQGLRIRRGSALR